MVSRRTRRAIKGIVAALITGVVLGTGAAVVTQSDTASAVVYDAASISLKFKQANRVAVSPAGATGRTLNDIMKYTSVATINGVVVDAVVKTAAIVNATISKFDEGSAVSTAPPGSTQSVDDLLLTDMSGSGGSDSSVTYEFSFYEGGTYSGPGSGVPVTLGNVSINSYDIDGNGGVKQYTDFGGFQSYLSYNVSATQGLDVSNPSPGLVRFLSRSGTTNVNATSGSYSFSRVQVNYDQVTTLSVRIGELGSGTAYYGLDFSAGGTWTTDGSTVVTPTQAQNPYNAPPTTADIATFFAAQNTGYVFRASDFPYADLENNAFASLKVVAVPAPGTASLEYNSGAGWVPVSAGDVISTSDLDLGKLRLVPTSTSGAFTFQVNDGLAFSGTSTLTFTASTNGQTIDFANPGSINGTTSNTFASGATTSSGLTPTLTSLTTGVCTVSGLTITTLALPAGVSSAVCIIIASQEGDADFGRAEAVTQQFSVSTLTSQSITFTNPGDRVFSASPIATDASATSGLPVTLVSLTLPVCTTSGTTITPVSQGVCSIRATQAGNGTYSAASPITHTFSLTRATQTVTFAPVSTQSVETASLLLAPSTTASGLTPVLSSSTLAVCTVSGFTVTLLDTGLCTLTAEQSGDSAYLPATSVTRSFTIFDVTTASYPLGEVGTAYSASQTLAGAAGGGEWSTSSALPDGVTLDTTTGELAGTPTAEFDADVAVTYTEDGASRTITLRLTIDPAPGLPGQAITFAQPATRAIDDGDLTVSPTTDAAALAVTLTSSTPAVCSVSASGLEFTVGILDHGVCTLDASQPGDGAYAPAISVARSFRIIEVVTTSLAAGEVDAAYTSPLTVAGAAGSGTWSTPDALPAGLTLDPNSGELAGTPTETFSDTVTFVYTEDGASHSVDLLLEIAAAPPVPQVITFVQPGTASITTAPTTLNPTTDALGLTPTLASSTPAVCTVSGATVSYVGAGTCTLTASQAGSAAFLPATDVTRSFAVIRIATTSLPDAEVGSGYVVTLLSAGGTGTGTWSATGLPAGITLNPTTGELSGTPTSQGLRSATVTYTEGGATHTVTLALMVDAQPSVPKPTPKPAPVPAAAPEPAPAVVPVATPKPRAPVLLDTSAPQQVNTVDVGSGTTRVAPGARTSVMNSDELSSAVRTVDQLRAEPIAGFVPGASVQVDAIGAKTLATLAIAPTGVIDATFAANVIRTTMGSDPADFAQLTQAQAIAASQARPSSVTTVPSSDLPYFELSHLDAPRTLASVISDSATQWVHFAVDVTGYQPGSTVYLAMTSTPIVFASSEVDRMGTASLSGDMALDVLGGGVHYLRVIGDRDIGSVSVDASGQIMLSEAQLAELAQFDQGTDAAVRISGDNTLGGSQMAIRIVPIDQQIPWWMLWVLIGLAVILSASRIASVAEGRAARWVKRGLFVVASAAPILVGILLSALPLTFASAGVLVVGVILAITLPQKRTVDSRDVDAYGGYDDWDPSRLEQIAARNRAAHAAYAPH